MKKGFLLLLSCLLVWACEANIVEVNETGTIEGSVTIGPLCGNISTVKQSSNPCGFSDEQINAIYSKYQVLVDGVVKGNSITQRLTLAQSGTFTFKVPIGSFKVKIIMPDGRFYQEEGKVSEKEVIVNKNMVTKVEIYVNTGIK